MKIFGIINITPDSFSDGGKNFTEPEALKTAEEMLNNGAYALDLGAESTRPNAKSITANEEIERLKILLPKLVKENILTSVDTRNFETAKWALNEGAKIINDVSGFKNPNMPLLLKEFNATGIFMHSLTVPTLPSVVMESQNFSMIQEIINFANKTLHECLEIGVKKEQLIFDCGIGFGKTAEQSIFLIQNIEAFKVTDLPIFVGHSRKSFLKTAFKERFLESEPSLYEKDLMTNIFSALMFEKVDFLRVHNVKLLKSLIAKI